MQKLQGTFLALFLIATAMATPTPKPEDAAVLAVSQGANQFSSELFQTIAEKSQGGNLICSPLSVDIVLAMVAGGARGETEKQLVDVLHTPQDKTLAKNGYKNIIDNLNSVTGVELKISNKVFIAEKFPVLQSYKELTQNYFHSVSQSVDFAKPAEAVNTINTWVGQQTNNRIKDIITTNDVDSSTAMVLVNGVYFKGQWKNKFDPELTKDLPFHVNDKTVKNVPTMYKQDTYKYAELPNLKARSVEIPYKGDELSMLIILPNEIDGLAEVERNLKTVGLASVLNEGFEREVQLSLPKFTIESKIELVDILKQLGLNNMFESRADFSGIANAPLVVNKVVQKAFIEVNEEGSEAAAVTELNVMTYSLTLSEEFTVDHPFLYVIAKVSRNQETGNVLHATPLFMGQVYEPQV